MCSGWRVAVAAAAICICAKPRCRSGPVRPPPISEGGVRVRGFPVACYGGAARFGLVSLGPNNTLVQCDHAGAPCVCELFVVECLLGLCITSSVLGHVHNASHQVIQNRRHVLACFHGSAKRCIHARRRGSLGVYRTLCANSEPLCVCFGA
ncbi:hypothetical protein Tc00.1047053510441.10 [Trypanosoma cruzi]|uniref:Secreted protein n=1 Tax=Trypanosoma cruzi (strain CL Brener) TaxID=353153 RepID=Q4D5T9_TRYCC|nr:hypothetical protein Tc00.1047053510441.10 [Trypanosoma cruzi]EAN87890.1 hypothetical protein Tc00.1047053510441.10 [Trypanosoma cruzi]|eukprot:XP_809741.1 hypothetical protein [Trypanosoma cruzi strain CL Brener]